jgi:hypothetical protein
MVLRRSVSVGGGGAEDAIDPRGRHGYSLCFVLGGRSGRGANLPPMFGQRKGGVGSPAGGGPTPVLRRDRKAQILGGKVGVSGPTGQATNDESGEDDHDGADRVQPCHQPAPSDAAEIVARLIRQFAARQRTGRVVAE